MCNVSSFIEARAKVEDARNIMDSTNFTLEQILDMMKIEPFDRPYFIDQLTDDNK